MRIRKIRILNFGSYESENVFETNTDSEQNIVLIGGKNGSGKTTLFTALRVCLYGHLSMGYKNANSYYHRAIIKLINNTAKTNKPCYAAITLYIDLNNGRGLDDYVITRKWTLADILTEELVVEKNSSLLGDEETADFENYLLALIPPELFNLYFFDGERIASFFLSEGSNTRIKEAFLTLCGYDTFEIMRKNFRRISNTGKGKTSEGLNTYLEAREKPQEEKERLEGIQYELNNCTTEIDNCCADITALDTAYANSGGITQEEWDQKIYTLKDEERKRESWNAVLKKWANDIIPFIMVAPLLEKIKRQIDKENNNNKCRSFIELLDSPELAALIGEKRDDIEKTVLEKYGTDGDPILDLSFEQSANLLSQVSELLSFDRSRILKAKKMIKQSISKSAKLRKELEQSSITTVQEYMRSRAELFEKKSTLLAQRIELEQLIQEQRNALATASAALAKAQATLEEEIKQQSIGDISSRAIIMLDRLQAVLYRRQIERVETLFRRTINGLIRKTSFIDDIEIDDNFIIHVFRDVEISGEKLKEIILTNTADQFASMFGSRALKYLEENKGPIRFGETSLFINDDESVVLPVEVDKESFSNGEKQIFIMSLYYSLVQLGNHEIPFVIDTPFARIDTEHRKNISKQFFCALKGQVFILSTNEEITREHVEILQNKIHARYLLENTDNKKTIVVKDAYFGVANDL